MKIISPPFWPRATAELSAADPLLANIIAAYEGDFLTGSGNAFHTLARSITGQQISVKAADAIWFRLEAACGGKVSPQPIANFTEDQIRALGYSRQKALYLQDLARYFLAKPNPERAWAKMSDEEVIRDLLPIKGIGRWTVEMFLIFHLHRPDVFPIDDLGVLKAIRLNYPIPGGKEQWEKAHYLAIAERWKPWRSVATWYLWRSLDPVTVTY